MSEEHDHPGPEYRPRSPDLSGFDAPLPRLNRIPSYHAPQADPNFPPGYSNSPRGSYDASPFFSPQTTTPSTSYFGFRTQSSFPTQTYSPHNFRTPNPAGQASPSRPSQPLAETYTNPTSSHYSPPQHRQPFNPTYSNPPTSRQFSAPPSGLAQSYGDMPQTRPKKAAEDLDLDYNPAAHETTATSIKAEQTRPLQSLVPMATTDPSHGIDVKTKFPVARIKRIMQADEDVGKVAQATPTAVSKALELFMIALVTKGAAEARANHSKRVTAQHLKAALMKDGQFDFLTDICENVPDEGSRKGRAKSEVKSEDSEEDIGPKKKGKGGRKRKATSDEDSD
ncbi:uncharacterized protein Z518_02563 [Rhinocladiella mackenziei CBS 650.93]|uniref:NCT transcriptional regulatory complex subunit A n=1 Tax=Rhinocladiella mackenziei CBS 650.93 TaxID=1442369 RepID=A0A0D2IPU0_9EURO|nr:uncharacterized protein Z518_02563 [Rhinocladiella mackenziei CBS 650.93]KIX07909.1 hypothetical protein Z518_02563 [Rhinocladiella mackenziei CBS 650.93]